MCRQGYEAHFDMVKVEAVCGTANRACARFTKHNSSGLIIGRCQDAKSIREAVRIAASEARNMETLSKPS